VLLTEGSQYLRVLSELVRKAHITNGQIHDARIAAICMESGVRTLWSADRDFSKFPKLKVINPLL